MSMDLRNRTDGWRKPIPGYAGHREYSWSRADPTHEGPHAPSKPKLHSLPHVQWYLGHDPRWRSLSTPAARSGRHRGIFEDTPLPEPGFTRSVHAMPKYGGHRPLNWNPSQGIPSILRE
mmetsp:Transcript_115106/g.229242  ORF Transcript_115106/g.229242 Transcript_115106/m.229242 type:complete len:119 (-) Transcript_115106:92-448(-)